MHSDREKLVEQLRYVVENPSAWDAGFDQRISDLIAKAVAALAPVEAVPVAIPVGWFLVPEVPTEDQMQAGLYQASHDAQYEDVCQSYMDMVRTPVDAPVIKATGRLLGYIDPSTTDRKSSLGEPLNFWCSPVRQAAFTEPVYAHPPAQAGAVTEEPGTIERHDFGSKAGDPDWCYSCGEHRSHPAHAESQRPYPFTLLDLDIARIIDPSSFLPGADEQDQNLAIAKAKRIAEALTAALGAQTPPEGAVTEAQGWRDMKSAPKDGTIIEAVGRYPEATAGFPRFVGWREDLGGGWHEHSRHAPEKIICWAWRPRAEWPAEPPVNQSGGADRG